jgi:ABC-type glutathione transport system ATPase component
MPSHESDDESEVDLPQIEAEKPQQVHIVNVQKPATSAHLKDELVPIQLYFEDIKFSVPIPRRRRKVEGDSKTLLDGVSGVVNPGTLLALMGSSGAGLQKILLILKQKRTEQK